MANLERLFSGPEPHEFQHRFRAHRVTQTQLGHYLGYSQQAISAWLRGAEKLPRHVERRMDEILNELDARAATAQ